MSLFSRIDRNLQDTWTDVFRADFGVHFLLMGSIIAGVFQGWLKDRMGGPIPYALSDGMLVGAVTLWFAGAALRKSLLGGTRTIGPLLLALILVPLAFLFVPGTPMLIRLAGLRTWVIFPLACMVALTIIRSTGQLRAYVGLVLLLATLTAVYGIVQYRVGPDVALQSPLGQERHAFTVFYSEITGGTTAFRAFSTFNFPAPFAGFMVIGTVLASGIALSQEYTRRARIMAFLLMPLFFVAITVSGTRAAVISLAIALAVVGWLRGFSFGQLLLVPLGLVAAHLATAITAGQFIPRLASVVLEEGEAWSRAISPMIIATRTLESDPIGIGLGRSGVGVPFRIFQSMPDGFFRGADGDLARVAVELGLVGVALLLVIVFGVIPIVTGAARRLVHTDTEDAALAIGAIVLSTSILLLIGSPLTSAPHAVIWWFFAGAIIKLDVISREFVDDSTDPNAARGADVADPLIL